MMMKMLMMMETITVAPSLRASFFVWLGLSFVDSLNTPRAEQIIPNRVRYRALYEDHCEVPLLYDVTCALCPQKLVLAYQWCMVGYLANLILTLVK